MRAVLFFCLNSLGLICELLDLVSTQTRQPDFAPFAPFALDCKLTKAGREYAGPLSVTRSGLTCQLWNFDQPHRTNLKNSTLFPEGSAEAAGNRCRNPDKDHDEGVWCYTTNPEKRWEECDLGFCDCKLTKAGHEYAGPLSVTRSGRTCQRWNSDLPHSHEFKEDTFFPDGTDEAAGNKCRNPERGHNDGVWCYTTDPNIRWEHCNVEFCDCQLLSDPLGVQYEGKVNQTRSGKPCSLWTSQTSKLHPFNESIFYPNAAFAADAGNYCRNPNASRPDGPWCFTNDPDNEWEYCFIPVCSPFENTIEDSIIRDQVPTQKPPNFIPFISDCKLTKAGREYAGPLSVTRSGLTCQRWNSNQPHSHRFRNSTLFPEDSADSAGNRCRNPDKDHDDGVWCYTTNPDKRWEECDVGFCDCKLTKAGHEYAGPLNVTRSGLPCQRWNSNKPHSNRFRTSTLFPEGSAEAAGSNCRNPERDHDEGVWCYTTNPEKRWEECDVKLCVFSTKSENSTNSNQTSSTQTRLSTQTALPPSTMDTQNMPPSPTLKTEHTSLSPIQLPQNNPNSRENAASNSVKIVLPIVGLIALICLIAAIIAWKRCFYGRNSPGAAEVTDQRASTFGEETFKENEGFHNPVYMEAQQLIEMVE